MNTSSLILEQPVYNEQTQELTLVLAPGYTYIYENVPADIVQRLETAPSAGSYYSYAIKNRYNFRRG